MAFQLIELMPREEWNQENQHGYRKEMTAAEQLNRSLENMIEKDFKGPDRTKAQGIEHVKTDDMDLSVYIPRQVYNEPLVDTLTKCYNGHHPIALSPDLIYGHLGKAIAKHVDKFPEELRNLYVAHKGKKTLKYRNDSYVKGSKHNDWALAFKSFADQLKVVTKENSLVQNDLKFSTSSEISISHRHVLSMESMKNYYEYKLYSLCGMSAIILEGTKEDWSLLNEVVTKQMSEINEYCEKNSEAKNASLDWWSPHVVEMLTKIHDSYVMQREGTLSQEMKDWWSTIYKYNAALGSGEAATASGWINILFPYLSKGEKNPWFGNQESKIEPDDYPSYNSSVPFVWNYHGTEYKMRAIVGNSIPAQVSTSEGAVYPQGTMKIFPAWAIVYETDDSSIPKTGTVTSTAKTGTVAATAKSGTVAVTAKTGTVAAKAKSGTVAVTAKTGKTKSKSRCTVM